jgi:hypothetical protein
MPPEVASLSCREGSLTRCWVGLAPAASMSAVTRPDAAPLGESSSARYAPPACAVGRPDRVKPAAGWIGQPQPLHWVARQSLSPASSPKAHERHGDGALPRKRDHASLGHGPNCHACSGPGAGLSVDAVGVSPSCVDASPGRPSCGVSAGRGACRRPALMLGVSGRKCIRVVGERLAALFGYEHNVLVAIAAGFLVPESWLDCEHVTSDQWLVPGPAEFRGFVDP